jgi:gamma-glutamylcysteine synthetase
MISEQNLFESCELFELSGLRYNFSFSVKVIREQIVTRLRAYARTERDELARIMKISRYFLGYYYFKFVSKALDG